MVGCIGLLAPVAVAEEDGLGLPQLNSDVKEAPNKATATEDGAVNTGGRGGAALPDSAALEFECKQLLPAFIGGEADLPAACCSHARCASVSISARPMWISWLSAHDMPLCPIMVMAKAARWAANPDKRPDDGT
jgi:hypothetical protein